MATLAEQLKEFKQSFISSTPPEVLETLSRSVSLLQEKELAQQCLNVGDRFPEETLHTVEDKLIELNELISKGPLIVCYFRGGWCPYCVIELRAWSEFLKTLEKAINFVAVTGEAPELASQIALDYELNFPVLVDKDYELANKLGLTFELDEALKNQLLQWHVDISKRTCRNDFLLPIPATYVIDQNAQIRYAFLEEDFTDRAEPDSVYHTYLSCVE